MRRSYKWILSIVLALLVSIAIFFYRQNIEIKEFTAWINQNAVVINGNEPFLDSTSFNKISSSFNNSKVIAIGESTHGTHEFDVLKLEFLKYLVKEKDCRTMALEASFSQCWIINSLLNDESISTDSLVRLIGFTNLQTKEFRNTIQWIRDYNKQHPLAKVTLTGFDIQGNRAAVPLLESFFNQMDTAKSKRLVRCIKKINRERILTKDSQLHGFAMELNDIVKELKSDSAAAPWPFEINMFLRVIGQYALAYGAPDPKSGAYKRDSVMAENVLLLTAQLPINETILLSAHNGHISKSDRDGIRMGNWLTHKLESKYFTIGLDFHKGQFRADNPSLKNSPGWENIEAESPTSMSLGNFFSQAEKPNAFLLLKLNNGNSLVEKWIHSKFLYMNSAGSISVNSFFNDDTKTEIIGKAFDSIIMLERSNPTIPLK